MSIITWNTLGMERTSAATIRRQFPDGRNQPQRAQKTGEPRRHGEPAGGGNQREHYHGEVEYVPAVAEVPVYARRLRQHLQKRLDDEYAQRDPVAQVHPVAVSIVQRGRRFHAQQYRVDYYDGDDGVLESGRAGQTVGEARQPASSRPDEQAIGIAYERLPHHAADFPCHVTRTTPTPVAARFQTPAFPDGLHSRIRG